MRRQKQPCLHKAINIASTVCIHLCMNHFFQELGLWQKWGTLVFSRTYDERAEEHRGHSTGRDNDAVARNFFTSARPLIPLHIFKGTNLCRVVSTACRNKFQIFSGHSRVLVAQLNVDITSPWTFFICSAANLLVYVKLMKTFLFRLKSADFCSLYFNWGSQRLCFDHPVMKILFYVMHALAGIVAGEASWSRSQRIDVMRSSFTSLLYGEPCTSSVWDLRPDVVEDSGGAPQLRRSKKGLRLYQRHIFRR